MQRWLAQSIGAVLASVAVGVGSSADARDAAPIVYAGQGGQQASPNSLAGGNETSYGYGVTPASQASGPLIDLRRPPVAESATPQRRELVRDQRSQAQTGQGQTTPDWLEHERVGPPYQANGRWYVPTPEPGYSQTGAASWYGPGFHGQASASGETYDQNALTAAMPTLPIPSLVQVTNLANGREVILRVTDRGPFVGDRIIDVSHRAAEVLGFDQTGTARVHVRYLGPAPRHWTGGDDGSHQSNQTLASAQPMQQAQPVRNAVTAPSSGPVSLLPPQTATETNTAPSLAQATPASWTPPQSSAPAAPIGGGFMVQVGAYSDLMHAQQIRAAVQSAGPALVDIRTTASGELYRVRLGPFASRQEADAARRSLSGLGYGDAILASR